MGTFVPEVEPPCYYYLTWQQEPSAFKLSIAEALLAQVDVPAYLAPRLPLYRKNFREVFDGDFEWSLAQALGFAGCLRYQGASNGFRHYLGLVPQITFDGGPCGNCNETGEDEAEPSGRCFRCRGTGREREVQIAPAYHLAGSLELLLSAAQLYEGDPGAQFQQLMVLSTVLGPSRRCGVGGGIGPSMHRWLADLSVQPLPGPLLAMKTLWITMYAKKLEDVRFGFLAETMQNGGFHLTCEGDACYVSSGGAHLGAAEHRDGYDLYSHNVDYVPQVLALLAGLAELWRMALQQLYQVET